VRVVLVLPQAGQLAPRAVLPVPAEHLELGRAGVVRDGVQLKVRCIFHLALEEVGGAVLAQQGAVPLEALLLPAALGRGGGAQLLQVLVACHVDEGVDLNGLRLQLLLLQHHCLAPVAQAFTAPFEAGHYKGSLVHLAVLVDLLVAGLQLGKVVEWVLHGLLEKLPYLLFALVTYCRGGLPHQQLPSHAGCQFCIAFFKTTTEIRDLRAAISGLVQVMVFGDDCLLSRF